MYSLLLKFLAAAFEHNDIKILTVFHSSYSVSSAVASGTATTDRNKQLHIAHA